MLGAKLRQISSIVRKPVNKSNLYRGNNFIIRLLMHTNDAMSNLSYKTLSNDKGEGWKF